MNAIAELVMSLVTPEQMALVTDFDQLADTIAASLDTKTLRQLHFTMEAERDADRYGRFDRLFPDDGPFRRDLYPKHLEHFAAGKIYRERCFMAANRIGKTVAGSFEVAQHLTGLYKPWWDGRLFRRPNRWWVAGDTNETTRDILQLELLGEVGYRGNRKTVDGSGIIPRESLGEVTWKQGVQNLVDTIEIKHKSGGWSKLGLKSYDQGRRAFQGTAKEGILLDEEPPQDVYGECLVRTATTRGIILITFTPLLGISEVVQSFLPKDYVPSAD